MVRQLRHAPPIVRAASTIEALRRDVELHHDVRIERVEIEFVEAFVQADLGLEDEAAAVPAQEMFRALEILRLVLFPEDDASVLVREVHLHRGDRGARRQPCLLLRRQRREAREFREARELALSEREVPAVQMDASAEAVLPGLVDDLPVGEVGPALSFDERLGVPPELQRYVELRGLPREVGHRERIPAIRQEDVGILRPYDLVDSPEDRLLVSIEFDLVEARPEEPVLQAGHPHRIVDAQIEEQATQAREIVVEGEVVLLRMPPAVRIAHEPHWEDVVLDRVALARPQVDVEETMVDVASVRVEDVRDLRKIAIMAGHDLEDRFRFVVLERNPARDLADLTHAIEDFDALADGGQLAWRGVKEERRQEVRVHDALVLALVPEPEDHRVVVDVGVGVDDPSVREAPPAVLHGPRAFSFDARERSAKV